MIFLSDVSRTVVWIVGHSYVFWADRHSRSRSYSSNLGLDSDLYLILWSGVRGMRWRNVKEHIVYLSSIWPSPQIIVIHAGANDLGKFNTWDLLCEMKRDLHAIALMFPGSTLAYSEMVPRLLWSPQGSLFYVDRIRRRLNRTIHGFMSSISGSSFRHFELEGFLPGLFRDDKVHLSGIGLDIFNMGIQSIIESATVVGGPRPVAPPLATAGGE